jgi:phospholipid transport system transporter-binding protein
LSEASDVTYRVQGQVSFDNLVRIRDEGELAMADAGGRVVMDLSALENGNSAAVALLMAWFRAAENQDKSIVFVAAPTDLVSFVELSGLTDVLPLVDADASAVDREAVTSDGQAGT